jgi:flagellum-specific peptidoglycan hydrolase FlgJ
MFEEGKAAQIAREMKRYRINILGLSETHWTGSGQLRLATGDIILFSGHTEVDAVHSQGVAIMLPKKSQKALVSWEAISSRIITASFTTKHKGTRMNIIQVYAPTNDAEQSSKDEFYNSLQEILEHLSRKHITILMGDLNAKIGEQNAGYERVMGKYGLGNMNENGERLADLCMMQDMVVGGSIFQHKDVHKATWVSPDQATENQIDHICYSRRFRRSVQDVRVRRGADAASDHHLLIGKLKLKLKNYGKTKPLRIRYNTELLENKDTAMDFKLKLTNRFQTLQDLFNGDTSDVNSIWCGAKDMWNKTCEETVGFKTRQHKEWITPETLRKIDKRKEEKAKINDSKTRTAKAKSQAVYAQAHKEVRKSIKQDKQTYIDNMAKKAEEAAGKNNMRDLYGITRKLSQGSFRTIKPIKNKDGEVLTSEEDQMKRWEEYFSEILNRPAPGKEIEIPSAEEILDINIEPPSRAEIEQAISKLKKHKAPGPDGITAEEILAGKEIATETLFQLFIKIWEREKIPEEWKEAHLIKIPKKGDLSECGNYRGISLLSIPSKVFSRILLNRIKTVTDCKLREEQAGFRQGRSCTDHIATLRNIVEQSMEWESPLLITFVDYEKAFDSVDRKILWRLLEHYGIPLKLVNLIKEVYEGTSCRVVHDGKLTDSFQVKTGVRQGCLLSPFLFLLAIDWIMKRTTERKRTGIQWTLWEHLEDLDFADDVALLAHSHNHMQEKLYTLHRNSTSIGLNINIAKTKVLKCNISNESHIKINDDLIEEVEDFTYLGSVVDKTGGTEKDIKARIMKARTAFVLLKNIWRAKDIKIHTKIRIFNTNVKSVLLYGSETWKMTKTLQHKLQIFVNNCLRRILNIRWQDKVRNEEVWRRTDQVPMDAQIKERRWRWIGHTLRKPGNNIARQSLTWNPQGKRKQGRPRNTWRRDVTKDLTEKKLTWRDAESVSKDREKWRILVRGLCTRGCTNTQGGPRA